MKIQLTPSELISQSSEMSALQNEYEALFGRVNSTLQSVNNSWSANLANNFAGKITSAQKTFSNMTTLLSHGASVATRSAETMENVDKLIANAISNSYAMLDTINAGFQQGNRAKVSTTETVFTGSESVSQIGGEISGDILSGEIEKKLTSKIDFERKDVTLIEGKIGAKGHLAKGTASGHIGIASGYASGTVGEGSVSGSVGATLYKNGKLSPQIGISGKAEASLLKGEVKSEIGNDEYNVHVKGEGVVGGAEAEAKANIGVISTTDKDGNITTGLGVEGKVSAEAYAVKGKISGGVTFLGIIIDVSLEGKAGGAGVSAGGSVTTNGISGELGAGLGIGAGIKLKIDWSGFNLKKIKIF